MWILATIYQKCLMMKTKSSLYRDRLLREMPTHTKSGIPIEIDPSGNYVRTLRHGARNGNHSVYTLCDYPKLFGWDRIGMSKRSNERSLFDSIRRIIGQAIYKADGIIITSLFTGKPWKDL